MTLNTKSKNHFNFIFLTDPRTIAHLPVHQFLISDSLFFPPLFLSFLRPMKPVSTLGQQTESRQPDLTRAFSRNYPRIWLKIHQNKRTNFSFSLVLELLEADDDETSNSCQNIKLMRLLVFRWSGTRRDCDNPELQTQYCCTVYPY